VKHAIGVLRPGHHVADQAVVPERHAAVIERVSQPVVVPRGDGEAQQRRGAKLNAIAVAKLGGLDAHVVDEGAVARLEVDDAKALPHPLHRGVPARNALVVHEELGAIAATDHHALAVEQEHPADLAPPL
jgi:hypothetical protein